MNFPFSAKPTPDSAFEKRSEQEQEAAVEAAEAAGPVAMLDLALALGEEELSALKAGEVETATRCCELRARLLSSAAETRTGENKTAVVARLRAMGYLQARLTTAGQELRASMADKLNRTRAESRRLRGYRQCVGHALAAF